ncbi:MAG: NAD-dependent epimerase/dehydratase family protein [Kofleriaceae bacterium]
MRPTSMASPGSIVVAGATGFVGSALAPQLAAAGHHVVGLTRGPSRGPTGAWAELRSCDLFSARDLEAALVGARTVIYLVHSMMPSARLVQGSFADLDLICADNLGRAARAAGVEQIVYLGGLVPAHGDDAPLSPHLASRLEVERALGAAGVPVTTLRAGLVIGPGGSSWQMLERLVRRLPWMLCPRWTSHACQPIDLATMVALLAHVVGRRPTFGHTYDVGGPDVLSYREMMRRTAAQLGLRRRMQPVPLLTPGLSSAWVSLVTGAPRALVRPLIESLRHDMVCGDRRLQAEAGLPGRGFDDAVAACIAGAARSTAATAPRAYQAPPPPRRTGVRSVQRIELPRGRDAMWAAHAYMAWLPAGVWPWLRVEVDAARVCAFYLRGWRRPLLILRFAAERSRAERQLFYIVGGVLARTAAAEPQPGARDRLEFRVTPDGAHLLTAIHDYHPRLPWWLYRASQAWVHRLVMAAFGRHLRRQPPAAADDGDGTAEERVAARG